jgi:histidine triad (HIT) family protein
MTDDCLFCRLVAGEIPAEVVMRTAAVFAVRDIDPQAPTHVLVLPTRHVPSLDALEDGQLAAELLAACAEVAAREGLAAGYRVVTNVGRDGGQSVDHLHFHVLGGRRLHWPPG